jgi:hypothetical protein
MLSTIGNPIYALQNILKKEKNLVVIEKIFKDTRILFEKPIIIIPRNKSDSK